MIKYKEWTTGNHINGWLRHVINKRYISSITDKKSKYVLLLLLFLLCKQQLLVNSAKFSCQKYQIAHTSIELTLRKRCPYSEIFWSAFSPREIRSISPYSVRKRENADQDKSEYVHFLHSISAVFSLIVYRLQRS